MTDGITWEQLVGMFVILGVLVGVWYRWYTAIREVRDDLAAYKLHVSEHFATKAGQREQTEAMLGAINAVRADIKSLNERIDRLFESAK